MYLAPLDGPVIASERDALDLIGATYGQEVAWIAIPASRLSAEFFRLHTGLAGAFLQKLVNYRLKAAILGDIAPHIAASRAFADFVNESNRGSDVWFARDEAELEARLAAAP